MKWIYFKIFALFFSIVCIIISVVALIETGKYLKDSEVMSRKNDTLLHELGSSLYPNYTTAEDSTKANHSHIPGKKGGFKWHPATNAYIYNVTMDTPRFNYNHHSYGSWDGSQYFTYGFIDYRGKGYTLEDLWDSIGRLNRKIDSLLKPKPPTYYDSAFFNYRAFQQMEILKIWAEGPNHEPWEQGQHYNVFHMGASGHIQFITKYGDTLIIKK